MLFLTFQGMVKDIEIPAIQGDKTDSVDLLAFTTEFANDSLGNAEACHGSVCSSVEPQSPSPAPSRTRLTSRLTRW